MKNIYHRCDEYFIYDDTTVKFTQKGIIRYRPLFGRAGIDIRTIYTYAQLANAIRKSRIYELADIETSLENCKCQNQADIMRAVIDGDIDKMNILTNKLKQKNTIRLIIVK